MRFLAAAAALALITTGCGSVTSGQGARASGPRPTAPTTVPDAAPSTPVTAPATSVPAASPSGPVPLRTVSVTGQDGTSYRVTVWAEDRITDCAEHSYGQVAQWFRRHPCRGATRRLLTLPFAGRTVALSAVAVGCATGPAPDHLYDLAAELARLERAAGTGSIDDLLREGARLPGYSAIPAAEAFDVESQDVGVFVMDAWYLGGPTAPQDPALVALEQNLVLTAVTS